MVFLLEAKVVRGKTLDKGEVGIGAHHPGADGFKVPELSLQLLGYGVDIAEAALQRMVLEDRGGARGIVGEVDRLARLVNGMGRGHADRDALLNRDHGAGAQILWETSPRMDDRA